MVAASSSFDLVLRDAHAADVPSLAALLAELGYPSRPERVSERLARLFADPSSHVTVALLDGVVIGYSTLHVRAVLEQDEPSCELTSLCVAHVHRGHGFGGRLLADVERRARARGCASVVLSSATRRADAHAFYERHGYVATGRRFKKSLTS